MAALVSESDELNPGVGIVGLFFLAVMLVAFLIMLGAGMFMGVCWPR